MSNEEILKKAISKAVENGWEYSFTEEEIDKLIKGYQSFIFSHSFAKAFWGKRYSEETKVERWQYHLQNIVLEKEPLKYIEKFL